MAAKITHYIEVLARESDLPESDLVARALRVGLRQLWRERILGRFLRDEVSRDDAIDAVGIDWVELAERQREAVLEDLAWAESM